MQTLVGSSNSVVERASKDKFIEGKLIEKAENLGFSVSELRELVPLYEPKEI